MKQLKVSAAYWNGLNAAAAILGIVAAVVIVGMITSQAIKAAESIILAIN